MKCKSFEWVCSIKGLNKTHLLVRKKYNLVSNFIDFIFVSLVNYA